MPDTQTTEELVHEFIEKLGVKVERIDTVTSAGHTLYSVRTGDAKRLIGPHGEHLRALNTIVRMLVEKRTGERERFMVDVNGYHQDRIRDIEQKARLLADRVRTFRSSAEMTPMNAYERMIIHALFADDAEITTVSEGEGKTRHVVIKYDER